VVLRDIDCPGNIFTSHKYENPLMEASKIFFSNVTSPTVHYCMFHQNILLDISPFTTVVLYEDVPVTITERYLKLPRNRLQILPVMRS
jgi:hypothetical protein